MLSLKLHYLMVDILVLHKYNERVDFVVVVVVIFCFFKFIILCLFYQYIVLFNKQTNIHTKSFNSLYSLL